MVNVNSDKEWIRRRQMRLMQVRKQSSDIAKMLRERVVDEEAQRKVAEEEEMESSLNMWKFRRLNDLEEMYRKAVKDFGSGHELASKEPVPERVERQKEYLCKARRRGESALHRELKTKEEANKKKTIPIQRKVVTRKIEDLRSMLVRSIAAKKSPVFPRNVYAEKVFDPNMFDSREDVEESDVEELSDHGRKTGARKQAHPAKVHFEDQALRKKATPKKEKCKKKILGKNQDKPDVKCGKQKKSGAVKDETSKLNSLKSDKLWVDLGVVEVLTENEEPGKKEGEPVLLKIEKDCRKEKRLNPKEKTAKKAKNIAQKKEECVECRGYSFSHNCNLKDSTGLVQRMDNYSKPDAVELALREEEKLLLRADEEKNRKMIAKERGSRAILKEKVNKSFTELLTKLEKLSTKEKLIKTYCHLPPSHVFFSDDRRRDKLSKKQQRMDSEFERIYYNAKGVNPDFNSQSQFNLDACAEGSEPESEQGDFATKLDLSQLKSDLKGNSRSSSSCHGKEKEKFDAGYEPTEKVTIKKTPSSFCYKRTKVIKGGKKTISDIDKVLEKGRKLRQESLRCTGLASRECKSDNDFSERKSDSKEEDKSQAGDMSLGSLASGSIELELNKLGSLSPSDGDRVSDILKDLTKSLAPKSSDKSKAILDLGMGDLGNNFPHIANNITAWPVHRIDRGRNCEESFASTTSYMTLPDMTHSDKFRDLIEILDDLRGRSDGSRLPEEQLEKLEDLLCSVMGELEMNYSSTCKDDSWLTQESSDLSGYISKLLDMSREKVSKLFDASSESESSPQQHYSPLEYGKSQTRVPEGKCPGSSQSPQQVKAKDLDSVITEWKSVLEQVIENSPKADKSKSFECEKSYSKPPKKSPGQQNKSRERTPKMKTGECSHSAAGGSCPGRETSGGGNVCKVEKSKSPAVECQAATPCEAKGHKSRDSSVKSDHKSNEPLLDESGINNFICDERNCPYLNHAEESYPDTMQYLMDKGLISSPFHWDKDPKPCDNSFITPVNEVPFDVGKCKHGCPSPCPGHTEVLKRRTFFDPGLLNADECSTVPHSCWTKMNFVDVAQGVYSPIPLKARLRNLKKLEKEVPFRLKPGDLKKIPKKDKNFDWNEVPDWYRYMSETVYNAQRPFLLDPPSPPDEGKPLYEEGRLWSREVDDQIRVPARRTHIPKVDFDWDYEDEDEELSPLYPTEKMKRNLEEQQRISMDCHGWIDKCDERCAKDIRSVTCRRLWKSWCESQRPVGVQPNCYHACTTHCLKEGLANEESDGYSSSDYENVADDTCGNACPVHCEGGSSPGGYEPSDDSPCWCETEKRRNDGLNYRNMWSPVNYGMSESERLKDVKEEPLDCDKYNKLTQMTKYG